MRKIELFYGRIQPVINRMFYLKILLEVIIIFGLLFLCTSVFGQNLQIKGKVIEPTGAPIPGANIVLKGQTYGTVANIDGEFSLANVPSNGTLVFSFIGYKPEEVAVNNKTIIEVTLTPDMIGLDEVVAIGYGTMRKADLTGSVSSIGSDDLVKTAAPNITSTLTGKLTGVITRQTSGRPGADSPTFSIRGKSTYGDNSALVLVDGIERDFNRIDPSDIESITILKDAASASVYGARGANGVILVTTKRGSDSKPKINYSTSYTSQSPTFMPEYMNAGDYAKYVNEGSVNKKETLPFTEEEVLQYQNGTLPSTDWWDLMMEDSAPIQQHNLSVNGKSGVTNYYVSLGYLDQKGLYEMANYQRYNLRSNIDIQLSDNLSVSLNIGARNEDTHASIISENKLHQTVQTAIPTQPAFVPEDLRVAGDELGLNFNGTAGSPIGEAIYSGYSRDTYNFLENSMGLKYNVPFVKGLTAKVDYSYDVRFAREKDFRKPYTLNIYTREAGLTATVPSENNITLNQNASYRERKTFQSSLNYERKFGSHRVTGLLLYEQMEYYSEYISAYREQFLTSSIDQLFAGSDINKDNYGGASENARQGYVGRVAYNYNEKYLLQANARYDGSYNFPDEGRWGFFPAFSAGWRVSEESFMDGLDFISNLKIRASWGQFGNDRVEPFYFLSGYEYSYGSVIGSSYKKGIVDTGIPNELITWETATNANIGFEFGLFESKLSGEFDYFTKRTEDILIMRDASVPATFGAKLPKENLGVVDNHGVEAILRYNERKGKLTYEIQGTLTYATSNVVYIDEPAEVEDRLKLSGRPFDSRFGYTALGLFQTAEEVLASPIQDGNKNKAIRPGDIKYLDLNNDSIINDKDRHYIGKGATPELIFGLNSSVSYNNFSFNMSFQGATLYNRYNYIDSFEKNYNTYTVLEDSWREGNEDAKYPRLESNSRSVNNSQYSTYWMNPGFYLKLRNIELAYTFEKNPLLDNLGIESVTFSGSGRNLLTFSKKDGFDPEGTDNRYPIMKTLSLGLNIVF